MLEIRKTVVSLDEHDLLELERIMTDRDEKEAFRLLKEFLKRLEQQKKLGLKSHLD